MMDKKLLQSLDNLSVSLSQIADSLEERNKFKSTVGSSLQSGNFSKQISEISLSISKVKSDTETILKNQETILRIVKEKKDISTQPIKTVKNQTIVNTQKDISNEEDTSENSFFTKIKDRGKPIKDSVGTIIMIAGGILAIGTAFKIIGDVNWVSVLALSTALPLIAYSFSKISEIKMTPTQVLGMILVTTGISTAILASSHLLSMVKPIGFFQATTAIMISGVFSAISFGVGKIIQGLKGINPVLAISASFIMPIVLYAVSYSIAKSSELLSQVKPIGFFQAATSILIAGVFTVLSYGIGKLIMGFKGINPGLALGASLVMPIVLVALSWSIYKSSDLLSQVKPIGFFQAVTAVMISGVFTILAYGIGKMISGFKGVSPGAAAIAAVSMPLLLIALSGSIMYSSEMLSKITPIGFFQALTAILISGVFVVLSYSVKPLMKSLSGVSYGDILKGGVIILGLVGTIVASSYIIDSVQEVSLSKLGSFTLLSLALIGTSIAFGMGLRVLSKVPVSEILKGGIAVLAIATVISLSSMILSIGTYDKFPSLDWTMGTGASLLAFGISTIGLGLISASGIGAIALIAGAAATLGVAGLIVGVDAILSVGSYGKHPSLSWSLGVGGSLLAFSTAVVTLGAINSVGGIAETLSLGVVDNPIDSGIIATTKIASVIPIVDSILSTGSYKSYPSLSWAGGVSSIMTIVSGAVVILGGIGILGGSLFDRGVEAIRMISQSIVDADSILSTGKYVGGPTKDWADSISLALSAFSPIYSILMKNSIMKIFGAGVSVDKFSEAIRTISIGISTAATHLSINKSSFVDGPPIEWSEGVSKSLSAFSPIYDILLENSGLLKSGITPEKYTSAIRTIVEGISYSAKYFSDNKSSFENPPPSQWASGVGSAISAFAPVYEALSGKSSWFGDGISVSEMNFAIRTITTSIIESSNLFGKNSSSFDISKIPDKKWSENINGAIVAFSPVFKFVSENSGWFGSDSEELSNSIKSISKSIADSSKILSYGVFNFEIPSSFVDNISKNVKSYVGMMESIDDFDYKSILNVIRIVTSLSRISQLIQMGSFNSSIPIDFTEKISRNIESYIRMINSVDGEINFEYPIRIVTSISRMSQIIQLGSFDGIIPSDFTESLSSNIKSYIKIISISDGNIGNITNPINIIGSISRMSQIIQLGSFNASIPSNFTENISKNIQSYLKTLNLIEENDYSDISSPIRFVSFLNRISSLISQGTYGSLIPLNFTENISKNIQSYIRIVSMVESVDSVGDISSPSKIIGSINGLAKLINSNLYMSSIPFNFIENVINNIESYKNLVSASDINSDEINDPFSIIKSINKISDLISQGDYSSRIPNSYILDLGTNIEEYLSILSIKDMGNQIVNPLSIIKSINLISNLISKGKYDSVIPEGYLTTIELSIRKYHSVIRYLIKNNPDSDILISSIRDISRVSDIISNGKFEFTIPKEYILNFGKNILDFINLSKISSESNFSGESISDISKFMSVISGIISSGEYSDYPSEEWTNGILRSISLFSGLKVGEINSNSIKASKSILEIDSIFSSGIFSKFPNPVWTNGILRSITLFSGLKLGEINSNSIKASESILEIDSIFNSGSFIRYPGNNWSDSIIQSITLFSGLKLGEINSNSIKASKSILEIDSIFNSGSFSKFPTLSWIDGSIKSITKFIESVTYMNSVSFTTLLSSFQKAKFISKSILDIDSIFSKGNYIKYPSLDWINGSKESILRSGNVSLEIENNLPLLSLVSGLRKAMMISESVFGMSKNISQGEYAIYPNKMWSDSVSTILRGFSGLDLSDSFDKESLSNIANSILLIDSKFKSGNFDKYPSVSWVNGTSFAIQKLNDLIKMMRFDSLDIGIGKLFGRRDPLMSALSNIDLLGSAFDKLSDSINSFTGGIKSIDLEKLSAIRSLSSSVVLMSITDVDQFNRVMDRLEDRSGIFAEILNTYNESKNSSNTPFTSIKMSPSVDAKDEKYEILSDRLDKMVSLLIDIASVTGSKGTLKSHLMSIKDDINIGSAR